MGDERDMTHVDPAGALAHRTRRSAPPDKRLSGVIQLQRGVGNKALAGLVARQPTKTKSSVRYRSLLDLKPAQLVKRVKLLSDADLEELLKNAPIPTTAAELRDQRRVRADIALAMEHEFRDWRFDDVVPSLVDLPEDAAKEFVTGRWITPLRGLGRAIERSKTLDAKAKQRLQAMVAVAHQSVVREGIDRLAGMRRDEALHRLELFKDWELEQFMAEPVTREKRIQVSEMVVLERARRKGELKELAGLLSAIEDDIVLAFLRRRTPDELRALGKDDAQSRLDATDRKRLRRLIWHAFALRVAREDEGTGLRELRYLEAAELEAVEDASAALGKTDAAALRLRIRRIRDSLQVEQVKGIIDDHLDTWSTGVALGVLTAKLDKGDDTSKKWFAIALTGNLVWAVTGFIPQVRGLMLAVKVVGQIGGAIVGSNTAQVAFDKADKNDPTTEFRLQLTDLITVKANDFKKDVQLIDRVAEELWSKHQVDPNDKQQSIDRRNTAWKAIFGDSPSSIGAIQRDTVGIVEAIWKSFLPKWKYLGSDIGGFDKESEAQMRSWGEWILEEAIVASGMAGRIGYKPPDRPSPFWGPGPIHIQFP